MSTAQSRGKVGMLVRLCGLQPVLKRVLRGLAILEKKMQEQDLSCSPQAAEATRAIFESALMRPSFTNAGEDDRCLDSAKMNYKHRQSRLPLDEQEPDAILEPADFDLEWDTGSSLDKLDCIPLRRQSLPLHWWTVCARGAGRADPLPHPAGA
ncbi:hypothetical protein GGR54DRAFT_505018 [Hypoxylon sp. NC1633]|nr:hypothetical protein GGR54DRAFT_505018 [Hypoxylon sp. NC1633]